MLAYQLGAGVHDEVKFFAEELVFAGDRHVVYDAAGVVMLNAAFVQDVDAGSFGGGKNEGAQVFDKGQGGGEFFRQQGCKLGVVF